MRTMKESGIPWIGEIPKDWSNAKYRYSGEFVKGKLPSEQNVEQLGKPIIGASEMLGKDCRNFSTDESVPTCQKKDILILWDGANAGIVANNCEGIVSSTAVKYVCTDKKFDAQYLFYLFKNGEPFFRSKVNGTTIPHMNQKYIDEYLCIQPPLSEQQRIAEFLDRKCAEVDEMIALQEQIIEELKAYKQSVITEAVTKGLNPDAPMRDSGIEWIGSIPEHWEVKRLKQVLSSPLQYGANESGMPYQENLPRYVRITDILDNSLRDNIEKQSLTEQQADGYILQHNDILFARSGGTVGKSFIFNEKYGRCAFAGYLIKASVNELMDAKFVYYFTQTNCCEEWKKQIFIQSTIQNIGADRYSQLQLTIPPTSEQQAIADYLDDKCADIDSLIQTKQSKIDSLKEYKKSIIYEYVTGKREIE